MVVVPDASVILKWVLPHEEEPDWMAARLLLKGFIEGDHELVVPSLWFFEVGNTLSRRFEFGIADSMLTWLLQLHLPELEARAGWGPNAVSLASGRGVTFYDASYYAVAAQRGGVLVTADRRFMEKLGDDSVVVALDRFPEVIS